MVLGIGFDEVVDPGILQGLTKFFFGDDLGNFTVSLFHGKNRTTEEALVNLGEGIRLMGWMMGIEPTTTGTTIRGSTN